MSLEDICSEIMYLARNSRRTREDRSQIDIEGAAEFLADIEDLDRRARLIRARAALLTSSEDGPVLADRMQKRDAATLRAHRWVLHLLADMAEYALQQDERDMARVLLGARQHIDGILTPLDEFERAED